MSHRAHWGLQIPYLWLGISNVPKKLAPGGCSLGKVMSIPPHVCVLLGKYSVPLEIWVIYIYKSLRGRTTGRYDAH